jgi:uncharacterized delta-60 repeat protein
MPKTSTEKNTTMELPKLICSVLMIFMACAHDLFAQPGDLDLNFGTAGISTADFTDGDDYSEGMALQPDGKIVMVGWTGDVLATNFAVARFNTNGTLDNTFSDDGLLTTVINGNDFARAVAIQPDGRIVVVGYTGVGDLMDVAVVRYNTDGTLDNSFSTDGIQITSVGAGEWAYGVALQLDGKILVAGSAYTMGPQLDFAIVRYNMDGTLDNTFGGDGRVTTDFAGGGDMAFAVALQGDGKIIAGGGIQNGLNFDFGIARYNSDGSLDPSFGLGGKVSTSIGVDHDNGFTCRIQSDGKILLASKSITADFYDFALVRYNVDGSLDTSFGTGGKVTTPIGVNWDEGRGLAIQPDGRIVLAGFSEPGGFALARYDTNGSLDTSFDLDGKVITSIGGISDVGTSIALQADGRILVGGAAYLNGARDFAVVRYGKNAASGIDGGVGVANTISVYPDPLTTAGTYSFTLSIDATLSLTIMDALGRNIRTVFSQEKYAPGAHRETIDLSDLAAGNYTLVLDNGEGAVSVKVVKQ